MKKLHRHSAEFATEWAAICDRNPPDAEDLEIVDEILADIRARGAAAVVAWSNKFDDSGYTSLDDAISVPDESWLQGVDPQLVEDLRLAHSRVVRFHEAQKPAGFEIADEHGNRMGTRWLPVARVGLYVPGGKAAYPSSVLMNAIPARVAGVPELIMVTPPGYMKPEVRAAAWIAGVDKVVAVGGVQAIGLLAYGAGDIQSVATIVGPGNRFVAAAKRKVFGRVSIDMIAGPSEILVLSDGSVDPEWLAADLLSQAEHDEAAVCGIASTDEAHLDAVLAALDRRASETPRAAIARQSVDNHAFGIVVASEEELVQLSNEWAPEHLELALQNAEDVLPRCTEAGSVFVGPYCPEAVGDYIGGPNHVLPTSGSARFFSPLGVDTFMKRSAFTVCSSEGLAALAQPIVRLAESEELTAHADSVRVRFPEKNL